MMIRPKGDPVDRGLWFDFWCGAEREWNSWHNRTEPTSLPGEKRRHTVYALALGLFTLGMCAGIAMGSYLQ